MALNYDRSSKFNQQMVVKHDCSSKFNQHMELIHDCSSKFNKQMALKHDRSSKFNPQMALKQSVVQNLTGIWRWALEIYLTMSKFVPFVCFYYECMNSKQPPPEQNAWAWNSKQLNIYFRRQLQRIHKTCESEKIQYTCLLFKEWIHKKDDPTAVAD